jgi:hypothetical protein
VWSVRSLTAQPSSLGDCHRERPDETLQRLCDCSHRLEARIGIGLRALKRSFEVRRGVVLGHVFVLSRQAEHPRFGKPASMSSRNATSPQPLKHLLGAHNGGALHAGIVSHLTPPGERMFAGASARIPTALVPLATYRDATQTSMWAKPCLAGKTYNAVSLLTFRERTRAHARAKPCLAGRPTMLVRTQCCETNTSRGRPTGMELPDYPVVALTPVRRTRMGPHLRFPPGLFLNSYSSFIGTRSHRSGGRGPSPS